MSTTNLENVFKPPTNILNRPTPMRLRVMELPSVVTGDDVQTPFLLIIDRCDTEQAERLAQLPDGWAERTGAKQALVFQDEVELP